MAHAAASRHLKRFECRAACAASFDRAFVRLCSSRRASCGVSAVRRERSGAPVRLARVVVHGRRGAPQSVSRSGNRATPRGRGSDRRSRDRSRTGIESLHSSVASKRCGEALRSRIASRRVARCRAVRSPIAATRTRSVDCSRARMRTRRQWRRTANACDAAARGRPRSVDRSSTPFAASSSPHARRLAHAGRPAYCPVSAAGQNTSARTSMLRRGAAVSGVVGSSNAVCAVRRARPSSSES